MHLRPSLPRPASWWTVLRSVFLGTYIIFNALVSSISIWHLSLSQSARHLFSLDVYIILISTLVLLGVFVVVFLEFTLPQPRFSRLWVECSWVSATLVTEFAGAVALSILGSGIMCAQPVTFIIGQSCAANSTLLAFLWISTAVAFFHLLTLLSFFIRARRKNVTIWQCVTRDILWSHPASCLPSVPASPAAARPTFQRSMIVAPQPRQARRPLSGLPSDYTVEHYIPPVEKSAPIISIPEPKAIRAPATFYGTHLQRQVDTIQDEPDVQPEQQALLPIQHSDLPPPEHQQQQRQYYIDSDCPQNATSSRLPHLGSIIRPLPSSPPKPLGDWPRADAMVRESTKKRGKRRAIDPEDQPSSSAPRPQLEARTPLTTVLPDSIPIAPTRSSLDRPRGNGGVNNLNECPALNHLAPTSFTTRTRTESEPLSIPATTPLRHPPVLESRRASVDHPPPSSMSRMRPVGPRLSSERRASADMPTRGS